MKKLFSLLFVPIFLFGCGKSNNKEINISEWMFDNTLSVEDVEKKLGSSKMPDNNSVDYYNWEIYDGITGSLKFHKIKESNDMPELSEWIFESKLDDNQYNSLHDAIGSIYSESKTFHQTPSDNYVFCGFATTYDSAFDDGTVYTIALDYYNDNTVIVSWGSLIGSKPK